MFISNFTNQLFVQWYRIFCLQLESNGFTLTLRCPVAICIEKLEYKPFYVQTHCMHKHKAIWIAPLGQKKEHMY